DGLTISQIWEAIGANNKNAGGAMLDNKQQCMVVRGVGLIRSVTDVENIVLDASRGVPIFVRDIGRARIGAAPPTGIYGINDQEGEHRNGAEGIVLMGRWEKPSEELNEGKPTINDL